MTIDLNEAARIRILNSDDLFAIMREVLMREEKIDQDREHFWVIGLAGNNKLLFVELVTLGTVNRALVEPMEVFSVALQKRAVKIMLVHNHPSGDLKPSDADKDITDRLIQVGLIINVPVLDHLVITPNTYFSFADTGLLAELEKSTRYVPPYKLVERYKKEAEEIGKEKGESNKARQIAKAMKEKGISDDDIAEMTGLPVEEIKMIKIKKG